MSKNNKNTNITKMSILITHLVSRYNNYNNNEYNL